MHHSHWTEAEDEVMRRRYPSEGASKDLCNTLERTVKAVCHRAHKLKIVKKIFPPWTEKEEDALRRLYGKISKKELILLCGGRSWSGILHHASRLELTKNTSWTKEEDEVLQRCYPDGRWRIIRQQLPHRTKNAIHYRAALLDIKMKDEARHRSRAQAQRSRGCRVFKSYGKIIGSVISHALAGAEQRGLECPLLDGSEESMIYLNDIARDRCALSGRPLMYKKYPRDTAATASLDRIDSSKGYIKGNLQWIHKDVNRMKSHMSDKSFVAFCREIVLYQDTLCLNH